MSPATTASVGYCQAFLGTADIRPDQTLVTAHRNLTAANTPAVKYWVERIADWTNADATKAWRSNQYFHNVGDSYQVWVAVVPAADVAAADKTSPGKGWSVDTWPAGWRVAWRGQHLQVSEENHC